MNRLIFALAIVVLALSACEKNPGEEGGPPLIQSVYTGHAFKSDYGQHRIRYVGMPNEHTMSFAGRYRSSVNIYFPKTTEIIYVEGCSFFIHYVSVVEARMEFLSCE